MLSGADCGVAATYPTSPMAVPLNVCPNLPSPERIESEADVDGLQRALHSCVESLENQGHVGDSLQNVKLAAFKEARDVLVQSKYYSGKDLCGFESERIQGGKCEREKKLFGDLACEAGLGCPSTWHNVGVGVMVVGAVVLIGGVILTEAALPVLVVGGLIMLGAVLILGYASHEESNQPKEIHEYPTSGGVDLDAGIPPEIPDAGTPSEDSPPVTE